MEAHKRAPALVFQAESTARNVCTAIGKDKLLQPDWTGIIFSPDALDAAYQDAVKLSHVEKTTRTMDEFLAKFDLHRRKARGRTRPGGTFPEPLVAALCLKNASLSRHETSPVLASTRGHLGI